MSMTEPVTDDYWTLIDTFQDDSIISTYEHRMPHGVLVLTETLWNGQLSTVMVFVPNPQETR